MRPGKEEYKGDTFSYVLYFILFIAGPIYHSLVILSKGYTKGLHRTWNFLQRLGKDVSKIVVWKGIQTCKQCMTMLYKASNSIDSLVMSCW